jgi:hypothetical protein
MEITEVKSIFNSYEERARRIEELSKIINESTLGFKEGFDADGLVGLYLNDRLEPETTCNFEIANLTDKALNEIRDTVKALERFTTKMRLAGVVSKFKFDYGKYNGILDIMCLVDEIHSVNSKNRIDNIDISSLYKYRLFLDDGTLFGLYLQKGNREQPEHVILNDFTYDILSRTSYPRNYYYRLFMDAECTMICSSVKCIESHLSTLPDIEKMCDLNKRTHGTIASELAEQIIYLTCIKICIELQKDSKFLEIHDRTSGNSPSSDVDSKVTATAASIGNVVEKALKYSRDQHKTLLDMCDIIVNNRISAVSYYKINDVEQIDISRQRGIKDMFEDTIVK